MSTPSDVHVVSPCPWSNCSFAWHLGEIEISYVSVMDAPFMLFTLLHISLLLQAFQLVFLHRMKTDIITVVISALVVIQFTNRN